MPTYEYACAACGNEWEEIQRITAPPTEVCPKCSKAAAHRLISGGTNFILKGGGWYSDLYSSSKSSTKKEDSGGKTGDSAGGTKSEAGGTKTESGGTKSEPSAKTEAPKSDASKGSSKPAAAA